MFFQTGTLNDKMHVLNAVDPNEETSSTATPTEMPSTDSGVRNVITAILSSPGPIVSFSLLVKKNVFRKHVCKPQTGKELLLQTVDQLSMLHFGTIESFQFH